jgi:hypothetical protein
MQTMAVDHVQFAVRDLTVGVEYLTRHGYRVDFHEPDFNRQARAYYAGMRKGMAYLKRGRSRVELITGSHRQGQARYIPIFEGLDSPHPVPDPEIRRYRLFWHAELSAICASKAGEAAHLGAVIVRARRPDASAIFWQMLGFTLLSTQDVGYTLAFPGTLLSMPLTVMLVPSASSPCPGSKVDDLGCSLVALITRNLPADRAVLTAHHYVCSEVGRFTINGRALNICMTSGPSGEMVELIEVGKD